MQLSRNTLYWLCPDQISFACSQFLNNDILIKTVEIVRENWEVAYFYRENEASIFDAKIQINLFFSAKHSSWAPQREMKSIIFKKKWISKSSKYFQSSWKMT